ncbi:aminotransferase class V-fold PLP-dependent enzyme [Magnetococcales bacterium HHB-1]
MKRSTSHFALPPSPFKKEFPLQPGLVYMNHAGVAPIPKRAADKGFEVLTALAKNGAFRYFELNEQFEQVRERFAALLQAPKEKLAFVPNTSEGLSLIALGVAWKPGDEIVTSDQEFPSNAIVWLKEAERHNLKVIKAPSFSNGYVCADRLLDAVTPRTRVVTVSSVQFGSGAKVDLEMLGRELRHKEILLVVDAIQSLGTEPLYPEALGIDALTADGHKWLLAPEGCGILYLSEKALDQVQPRMLGWHSVVNAGDYNQITTELRSGAKRFEAGSPNLVGAITLGESVALLQKAGLKNIQERIHHLVNQLLIGCQSLGCAIHTPLSPKGEINSGILIISHSHCPANHLQKKLLQQGIFQAARGAGIRLAPHFYQDQQDVEITLAALKKALTT